MAKRRKNISDGLLDQRSDWGLTMSEMTTTRSKRGWVLLALSWCCLSFAIFLLVPVLAAMILEAGQSDITYFVVGTVVCVVAGLFFSIKSSPRPRNAIQIDYRAAQLRLGHKKKDNTFMRERVIPFREIDSVYVDHGSKEPFLKVVVGQESINIPFHKAGLRDLENLAARIATARDSGKRAPVRSRVQTGIHSFGANIREVKSRVRSRLGQV